MQHSNDNNVQDRPDCGAIEELQCSKLIKCLDGMTRMVRLSIETWNDAYWLVNRGYWQSLDSEFDNCFLRAKCLQRRSGRDLTLILRDEIAYAVYKAKCGEPVTGPYSFGDLV